MSRARRLQIARALNTTQIGSDQYTGLLRAWDAPVAFWIDRKGDIRADLPSGASLSGPPATVAAILQDSAARPGEPKQLVTLVLHALPNRDCHKAVPTGETCCKYQRRAQPGLPAVCDLVSHETGDPTCEEGLADYKASIVDPLASLLEEYEGRVPVALVVEPGSLSTLSEASSVSSLGLRCLNEPTQHAYTEGVAYVLKAISARAPSVALYLDAGSGRHLGWGERVRDFAMRVGRLGEVAYRLRGFATNIGGYQPLGQACPLDPSTPMASYCRSHPHDPCCIDPCGMVQRFNSGVGELNFVQLLQRHLGLAVPGLEPHFLIDTGRNGATLTGPSCLTSCNLRGASFGHRPTAETDLPDAVDAYLWLLPPGLSDGCSNCPRGDAQCAREDAAFGTGADEQPAPRKGDLYLPFLRALAANTASIAPEPDDASSVAELDKAAAAAEALANSAGIPLPSAGDGAVPMTTIVALSLAAVLLGLAGRECYLSRAQEPREVASAVDDDDDERHADVRGRSKRSMALAQEEEQGHFVD